MLGEITFYEINRIYICCKYTPDKLRILWAHTIRKKKMCKIFPQLTPFNFIHKVIVGKIFCLESDIRSKD